MTIRTRPKFFCVCIRAGERAIWSHRAMKYLHIASFCLPGIFAMSLAGVSSASPSAAGAKDFVLREGCRACEKMNFLWSELFPI